MNVSGYFARAGIVGLIFLGTFPACQKPNETTETAFVDLSKRDKPKPIVTGGWQSVTISVPDLDDFARFFTDIGGYETVTRDARYWTLRAPGTTDGYIQLIKNDNPDAVLARPVDAKAWDTGCYWSVMMRAKGISSIVEDAKPLGWEPLTDIAYLEFGPSKLNVVVLRHQVTGAQVQLYERLTTPLPAGFPDFERVSRPFNIMQMVEDRDAAYSFFQQQLGFETFYYGKPYVSDKPENMPLGIPPELTAKVPYKAAIVYPEQGMEWGRFEMIEIDGANHGLTGRDFSSRCTLDNWGILKVAYINTNVDSIYTRSLEWSSTDVHVKPHQIPRINLPSPDGARIIFDR